MKNSPFQHDVEGWDLFEVGNSGLFEIQVDTDVEPGIFKDSFAALEYVERLAAGGSARHMEALEAHRRDAPALARLLEAQERREALCAPRG